MKTLWLKLGILGLIATILEGLLHYKYSFEAKGALGYAIFFGCWFMFCIYKYFTTEE